MTLAGIRFMGACAALATPIGLSLLGACGGRSDLGPFGAGGAGGSSSHASVTTAAAMSSSSTGAPLHCDPPKQKTVIATDTLKGALEVLVHGEYIYVLEQQDVLQISPCGGPPKVLAKDMNGMLSMRGFAITDEGVHWAMSGAGSGAIGLAPLDGSPASFTPTPNLLSVSADAQGIYVALATGSLTAQSKTQGTIPLASSGAVGYWAPLVVNEGWVYWAWAASSPFGQMIRVRSDGSKLQTLVPMRMPTDTAVLGDQVYTVTAHGVDELQTFDAKNPQLSAVAVVQSPVALALDAKYIYIADAIGVERAPLDASTVTPLVGQAGMIDLTVTDTAIFWIADDGTLSWVKKPL